VDSDSTFTSAKETLELAVCIQALNAKGEWVSRTRVLHIDPRGEGHFAVVDPQLVKGNPPMLLVETQHLEQAEHAE
jgi:hypothetical protein